MHMARKGIKPTSIAPMVGLCMANSPYIYVLIIVDCSLSGYNEEPALWRLFYERTLHALRASSNGSNTIYNSYGPFLLSIFL
jgi:hypothetical protein